MANGTPTPNKPDPIIERRQESSKYTEKLSTFMVGSAVLGGAWVLLDPVFTITLWGQMVKIGGEGFSADLKGAVVSLILIGGFTATKEYWLGASATGQKQSESMSRIAEAAAPAIAAATATTVIPPVPVKNGVTDAPTE